MPPADVNDGRKVTVHYTGTLEDGTKFSSTPESEPLQFTVGQGEVISGLENVVRTMKKGDRKQATVPPESAFGPRRQELVASVPKDKIPDHFELNVGDNVQVSTSDGGKRTATVADINDSGVMLDANHPLAGRDLVFDVTLVDIA
ncbi:MAG: peptidylprolyl isomerase [Chitinivibrionales bacterium]|nr:peptidylprolyl isomerase [Chitinivibrionales bacterium]